MSIWMVMLYVVWALFFIIYGILKVRVAALVNRGNFVHLMMGVVSLAIAIPPIWYLYQGLSQQGIH